MIGDITIGQYFPGKSVIHKMDPRMKIIFTMIIIVSLFLCKNFISLGFAVAASITIIAVSRISFKTVFKSIKPLALIIVLTAILNLFYGSGEPVITIGKITVNDGGIYSAIFMAVRIIILIIEGSMLTYTTSPTDLTDAIERLLKPLKYIKVDVHSIAMIMTIALRFIPTLIEEIEKIIAAQKSRGADIDSGNIFKRVKALVPVIIPLFVSSFRCASDLAYAMECRCYRGGEGRTKMKVLKMGKRDYFGLAAVIAFISLIIYFNTLMAAVI